MKTAAYLFLADGFEEIEAVAPADILKRSSKDVFLVSINSTRQVRSAHGLVLTADWTWEEFVDGFAAAQSSVDKTALVFPGGLPGTDNLAAFLPLMDIAAAHLKAGGLVCAICASPGRILPVLDARGTSVKGRRFTCYPGCEVAALGIGAEKVDASVVTDGNLITANGPGAALDFGYAICAALRGKEAAAVLKEAMMYKG
ncbi:MAG: DJ-1/PfpI family protein [Bacteroidales bacterium]|nr:DJ-1/PfpI family protein [Bacteroidales bacterium]